MADELGGDSNNRKRPKFDDGGSAPIPSVPKPLSASAHVENTTSSSDGSTENEVISEKSSMPAYICNDLVHHILKWVPVKLLLLCRCVCKGWKQLIDSKDFIVNHLSVQRQGVIFQSRNWEYLLLMDSRREDSRVVTLTGPDVGVQSESDSDYVSAVCTVNGIICLYNNANVLALWNPSIHQLGSIHVPESRPFNTPDDFKHFGFWMDPLSMSKDFRVDPLSKSKDFEYKILLGCFPQGCAALYSSTKQGWVQISIGDLGFGDHQPLFEHRGTPQVVIGEVSYWDIGLHFEADVEDDDHEHDDEDDDYDDEGYEPAIISFDFRQEKFSSIRFPEPLLSSFKDIRCFKWRGGLSVLGWLPSFEGEVWGMQDDEWSMIMKLNFPVYSTAMEIFCALEDSERFLTIDQHLDILSFDRDGVCTSYATGFIGGDPTSYATEFVESLVFPRIRAESK